MLLANNWVSFISDKYYSRTKVTPLTSIASLLLFLGNDFSMDILLDSQLKNNWSCFLDHQIRAFKIETQKSCSIVIITWLGRRGSRWRVFNHFEIWGKRLTKTHKNVATLLAMEYQKRWEMAEDQ